MRRRVIDGKGMADALESGLRRGCSASSGHEKDGEILVMVVNYCYYSHAGEQLML